MRLAFRYRANKHALVTQEKNLLRFRLKPYTINRAIRDWSSSTGISGTRTPQLARGHSIAIVDLRVLLVYLFSHTKFVVRFPCGRLLFNQDRSVEAFRYILAHAGVQCEIRISGFTEDKDFGPVSAKEDVNVFSQPLGTGVKDVRLLWGEEDWRKRGAG